MTNCRTAALPPSTENAHVYLWHRLEGESSKAFHAFTLYKDGGSERSLAKVGERLGVSRQALGKWSIRFSWIRRALAWDNYQSRTVDDAVLSELVKQARLLQRVAHHALERITQDEAESLSVAELCLMLRTVCSLTECSTSSNSEGSNAFDFPANLPPPVFNIVTYSKPESHSWVRHNDDPEAKEGFHVRVRLRLRSSSSFHSTLW
jgi:hypothetical protein